MVNVISYVNAGKRRYGENHWFWSIWIGTSDIDVWDRSEPTASGFSASKSAASRSAWRALHDRGERRAYFRFWGDSFLFSHSEAEMRPLFSRCAVGRNRWFWVVAEFLQDPTASGIASSPEEALKEAEKQAGPVRIDGTSKAKYEWKKRRALVRSQRVTDSSTAASVELVYECHLSCSDFNPSDYYSITPHRVVKRTAQRIFVERDPYAEHGYARQGLEKMDARHVHP